MVFREQGRPHIPNLVQLTPVSLPHPVPLLEEFGLHSNDLDPELDSANLLSLTVPSPGLPVRIEHRTKPLERLPQFPLYC